MKKYFDLAILDESLRDTTAMEILREVGSHPKFSVKYKFLSSKTSIGIIMEYIETGASDFVLKPFSLLKVVRRY